MLLEVMVQMGIPKVIVVIAILIGANLLWSYIKRLKRRAEQNQAQYSRPEKKSKRKPSDDSLGEYVDYEEVDD